MKKKCLASGRMPLSHPWEYRRAGSKKDPFLASMQVVVWKSRKRMIKNVNVIKDIKPVGDDTDALVIPFRRDPTHGYKKHQQGKYGPYLCELHLHPERCSIDAIVHELTHAIGELPKRAGRPHHRGKPGEIAAYRMQRLLVAVLELVEPWAGEAP